ncbi:patatin-like phospholipase family protein [Parabacteroides sp. OttesenSCG-928-G07]|nr:patatin-like phospholipase family protein [Parabacteroides sp. OttesenSCG-928-G07]
MEKRQHHNLGVALSGGGVRGFAHVGALKAMNERGLYPEVISGTSAGSLAGVFYADGYTPDEIYDLFKKISFRDVANVSFFLKEGLFETKGIAVFLKKYLRAKRFEELKIPFYAVASDIEQGKSHVFDKGDLIPAVIASCTVPIVFTPVEIDKRHYVDGGLFMNFPVSVIRKRCHTVIGVNVSPVTTMPYDKSFSYIIERTMSYMVGANTTEEQRLCDYLIESKQISQYQTFDFKHIEKIYHIGYDMASVYLDANKRKIERDLYPSSIKKMHRRIKGLIR